MATKKQLIEEIKAVQVKIADAGKGVNDLEAKLQEVESQQSPAHIAEASISKLQERKQDVQADIALGTGKQSDLDQVNKEIAAAQEAIETHTQTVAGLQRKLEQANQDYAGLKHKKDVLFAELVRGEAEELHCEYMEHAKVLVSLFHRLQALANIYKAGYTPDAFYLGNEHTVFSLPVFQFTSSGQFPVMGSYHPSKLIAGCEIVDQYPVYSHVDVDTEKARLAKLGIEC